MVGLSAAASVAGIISLAVQLVDTANKLHETFAAFRCASADVRALDDRLKLLTDILKPLTDERDLDVIDPALSNALGQCHACIGDVVSMVQAKLPEFGSTSTATRTWTSVKVLWEGRRLRKLTSGLADATDDLELALLASHRRQGHSLLSKADGLRTHVTNQSQVILDAIDNKTKDVKQEMFLLHDKTSLSYQQSLMQVQAGQAAHMRDSMAANASGFASVETAISNLATDFQQKLTVQSGMIQSRQEDIKRDLHTQMNSVIASAMPMFAAQASKQASSVVEQLIESHVVKLHSPDASARAGRADVVRNTTVSPGDSACSSIGRKRLRWLTDTYTYHESTFGEITIVSRHLKQQMTLAAEGDDTVVIEDDLYESRIKIVPSEWLRWLGLRYALDIRLVPNDAPIFKLCADGDIVGVQQLLSKGLASIHDVNEFGYGPLLYAVIGHNSQLCGMLLDAGMDIMVDQFGSYLERAVQHAAFSPKPNVLETAGILLRSYGGIAAVPDNRVLLQSAILSKSSLMDQWIWQQCLLDRDVSSLVDGIMYIGSNIFLWKINEDLARRMMAEVNEEWLQTVFMEAIIGSGRCRLYNVKLLEKRVGSLHFRSPEYGRTPLQLAMENRVFIRSFWQGSLLAAIEISGFFSAGLLDLDAGWTETSIATLLDYLQCAVNRDCDETTTRFCGRCTLVADVAYPHWQEDIERIRQGLDPDGPFTTAETEARATRAAEVQEEFLSMMRLFPIIPHSHACKACAEGREAPTIPVESEELGGDAACEDLEPSPGLLDVDF